MIITKSKLLHKHIITVISKNRFSNKQYKLTSLQQDKTLHHIHIIWKHINTEIHTRRNEVKKQIKWSGQFLYDTIMTLTYSALDSAD